MYILYENNSPELSIENGETELICVSANIEKIINRANCRIKANDDFKVLHDKKFEGIIVPQYIEMYKNGDENSPLWYEIWIDKIEVL